ncbi:MAG: methyltransferase, partial [bacterium]
RRFEVTALGKYLQTDFPGSMRPWVRFVGSEWHWNFWGKLIDIVKTGKSACEHCYGERIFEWLDKNPEPREIFNAAMSSRTEMANQAIISGYDFSPFGTLADIGGGHGGLLAAILKANPSMRGILFELPNTLEGASKEAFWNDDGLLHRCDFVSGDFFESIPPGADAYILKTTIHDWQDPEAVQILRNCRRAMGKGKMILIMEMIIPDNNQPFHGKLLDLEMMAMTGGCERTVKEYKAILDTTGFKLCRIVPLASMNSIIEGVAV